jgi:hypothetical protein
VSNVRWAYYPRIAASTHARMWLKIEADLGLAAKTVDACGRALED